MSKEKYRLKCQHCGSIRMVVYEGKNVYESKIYSDGSMEEGGIEYPLEIRCGKCGSIVRQEGGSI